MSIKQIADTFFGTKNDARFNDGWSTYGDDWAMRYLRGCLRRGVDRIGDTREADEALTAR